MNRQHYWQRVLSGGKPSLSDSLFKLLLTPASWLYWGITEIRVLLYKWGFIKTGKLPRPVISVGNIAVGGTGKTPLVAFITRELFRRGLKVALLSRGYGGSFEGKTVVVSDGHSVSATASQCGDEPFMLATELQGLIVVIGPDRFKAGELALQRFSPDIFILDDGFQHINLSRDLDILLLDFCSPFGNGLTLPAGILRESIGGVKRADLIIYTRTPDGSSNNAEDIHRIPVCHSRHTIVELLTLDTDISVPLSECRGKRISAFAGIANPESFFAGLRRYGVEPVETISLPDHADYNSRQCDQIMAAVIKSGAELLITTGKDSVKLRSRDAGWKDIVLVARMELTIDEPEVLIDALDQICLKDSFSATTPLFQ